MERKNPKDWNLLMREIQQPDGCLWLLALNFLRSPKSWVDRYSPSQQKYWQEVGNRLIERWESRELYLREYGPEELLRMVELSLKFSDGDLGKRQRFGATALWQVLEKKVSLGENFDAQITTGNDSYVRVERLGPVAKILLKDKDPRLAEAFVFGFGDLEQVFEADQKLFNFIAQYLPFIRSLYQDSKGKNYTRKVNEGLYLRHILRTMVLADEFYRQLTSKKISLNYDVLMMAAALHDTIEINKKNGEKMSVEYLQQRLREIVLIMANAYNISYMARFSIPQKDPNLYYFEEKKQDFERIWDGKGLKGAKKKWWEANKDYLRIIKAADVFANLEETVYDLEKGREDGKMKRSLVERLGVFQYRVGRIQEMFAYEKANELLDFIAQKI